MSPISRAAFHGPPRHPASPVLGMKSAYRGLMATVIRQSIRDDIIYLKRSSFRCSVPSLSHVMFTTTILFSFLLLPLSARGQFDWNSSTTNTNLSALATLWKFEKCSNQMQIPMINKAFEVCHHPGIVSLNIVQITQFVAGRCSSRR